MGPLHGVRVVELESLAPAPFGCMILADLGAEVIRVDRPAAPGHPVVPPGDPLARGRRSIRLDLKEPEGVAVLLRLAARADVLRGGLPPWGRRAARLRPGGLPGAQPPAGLRADDGLGAGRPAGPGRRARHRLHRGGRHAGPDRPGRRPPGAAAEPGRRLRRRRHAAGRGRPRRPAGAGAVRPRPGRGRGHGGRGGAAGHVHPRPPGGGRVAGRARQQPAGRRGAVLRHLPDRRWQVRRRGCPGAQVLRRAAGRSRAGPGGAARPVRPGRLARPAGRLHRPFRRADPGRVGRGLRRIGRLRGPRAEHGRRARPPAQRRPRHLHRGGRGDPARPGAPVQPDARGPAGAAAPAGRRHQRDPGRAGLLPGGDHRAQRPGIAS